MGIHIMQLKLYIYRYMKCVVYINKNIYNKQNRYVIICPCFRDTCIDVVHTYVKIRMQIKTHTNITNILNASENVCVCVPPFWWVY